MIFLSLIAGLAQPAKGWMIRPVAVAHPNRWTSQRWAGQMGPEEEKAGHQMGPEEEAGHQMGLEEEAGHQMGLEEA